MGRRLERLEDQVIRELSNALLYNVQDPRIGLTTLTRCVLSPDLSSARVFLSVLGGEKEARDTLAGLKSSSSYLRTHLAKNMHTKKVPKLTFEIDDSLAKVNRLDEIFKELNQESNEKKSTR